MAFTVEIDRAKQLATVTVSGMLDQQTRKEVVLAVASHLKMARL